jgi:bacteriocin biosynthesis cyclodehydratase domain
MMESKVPVCVGFLRDKDSPLADAIHQALASVATVVDLSLDTLQDTPTSLPCTLLVSVLDTWRSEWQHRLQDLSRQTGIAWLGLYQEWGRAIVGPTVLPTQRGCATCADMRRINADANAAAFVRTREPQGRSLLAVHHGLTVFAIEVLAQLFVQEVLRFLQQPEKQRTVGALLVLELSSLKWTRHTFLPEPYCPVCGVLPNDTAERAQITLSSQRKIRPGTYRVRSLLEEKDQLVSRYVDAEIGMITSLTKDASNLYANFAVSIPLLNGRRKEVGFGRAFSYELAQVSAIAEALERYAGMYPSGARTTVRASYRDLGAQALNPRELGLHSEEQYAYPDYPYVRYSDDLVFNWVWGYSFQRQQPILVPERMVYYGMHYKTTERPFAYEISNGCALGGCLEEAILHGMLEVIERDAFLMTWYARLPRERIMIESVTDPLPALMVERLRALTGYTIYAFNITLEQAIPCFWVMAVDEQQRPGRPRALCAAGSHLHPEKALINALQELAPIVGQEQMRYPQEEGRAREMLTNSFNVVNMQDHSLLYGLPEAFERLKFLYESPHVKTFTEAFGASYLQPPQSMDLRDDLTAVMRRYLEAGIDIIVVDQTTPEQVLEQFRCVKVMMPGMLPMTFGYHARRTHGLSRLSYIPWKMGYAPAPLSEADINPYPHPFP